MKKYIIAAALLLTTGIVSSFTITKQNGASKPVALAITNNTTTSDRKDLGSGD
jgi:hypothetical protein